MTAPFLARPPLATPRAGERIFEAGLDAVRWIDFPRRRDERGRLTFAGQDEIPFPIARIFYLRDVPPGMARGGHAHRLTEQVLIAIAGRFTLELTDGAATRSFQLRSPDRGLYVPAMIWDRLCDFAADSVALVLASTQYAEADYIRSWEEFQRTARPWE
jgi:hypothetical protein